MTFVNHITKGYCIQITKTTTNGTKIKMYIKDAELDKYIKLEHVKHQLNRKLSK